MPVGAVPDYVKPAGHVMQRLHPFDLTAAIHPQGVRDNIDGIIAFGLHCVGLGIPVFDKHGFLICQDGINLIHVIAVERWFAQHLQCGGDGVQATQKCHRCRGLCRARHLLT